MTRLTSDQRGSGNTRVLFILLASVAVLFAYLYFFTGLIKERQPEKNLAAPSPLELKQSLPPRPASPEGKQEPVAQQHANSAAPAGEPKPVPVTSQKPPEVKPPAAAPAPAVVPKQPLPAPASKAAAGAPAAAVPAKPPILPQDKTAGQVAAKKEIAKPDKSVTQPQGKRDAAKPEKTAAQPAKKKEAPATGDAGRKPATVLSTIETTETLSAVKADKVVALLRKGGLKDVQRLSRSAEKTMSRLFVAEFSDREAARASLEKLKGLRAGAFILPAGGKVELFAGSFEQESRATAERDRLAAQGVALSIKKTTVKVPVYVVVAKTGSKEEADRWLTRLRSQGIGARVRPGAQ